MAKPIIGVYIDGACLGLFGDGDEIVVGGKSAAVEIDARGNENVLQPASVSYTLQPQQQGAAAASA